MSVPPTMYWQQDSQTVYYYNGAPLSATFGDFDTTAYFSNNNYNIISNATLSDVMFTHNSITVTCSSPLYWVNEVISVAGENPLYAILVYIRNAICMQDHFINSVLYRCY